MTDDPRSRLERQQSERLLLDQFDELTLVRQEADAVALWPDGRVQAIVPMLDDLGTYKRDLSDDTVRTLAEDGPPKRWGETVLIISTVGELQMPDPAGTLHRAWSQSRPLRLEQISLGESLVFRRGESPNGTGAETTV